MTVHEKLKMIRQMFKEVFADPTPDPNAGKTFPLTDGTTITVTPDLQPGATAMIAGQPAPDGEYPLPDGSTLVVAGGVVANIEPAGDPGEPGDTKPADMGADVNWLKQQMETLIGKFEKQEQAFAAVKTENENLKAELGKVTAAFKKQNEGMEQLTEIVTEMAKEPEGKPAEKVRSPFAKQDKDEKIKNLADNLLKLRAEQGVK